MYKRQSSRLRSACGWEQLALWLILAVGFWLRFHDLGAIRWNIDQAYPVWQSLSTLDSGKWPLIGQRTSILFDNPPLTGYIFLPFMALTRLALGAMVVTITLNSFAIYFTYRGLWWMFGVRPALLGAALFAINPWLVEESRRTWVQSLQPFFITLIFWLLIPVLLKKTRRPNRRLLLALVALSIYVDTYLLAYVLTGTVVILLLIYWRGLPKRAVMIGATVYGLGVGLYAYGLIRMWDVTRANIDRFRATRGEAHFSSEAAEHAMRFVTGFEFAVARGTQAPINDWALRTDLSNIAHWLWFAMLVGGIFVAIYQIIQRGNRRDHAVILLVWFFFPIVLMTYVAHPVHIAYQILTVPAGFGLIALGAESLLKRREVILSLAVAVVFSAGLSAVNVVRFAQETRSLAGAQYPDLILEDITRLGITLNEIGDDDDIVFMKMPD